MSENSGDKGFKTLKLTTLKTATTAQPSQSVPSSSGAEPAPAPPPIPESSPAPAVTPTPAPEVKPVEPVPPVAASAPAPAAPAATPTPKPASLNLMSFKSGAAKKDSSGAQPPPSAASTPPPALSPSAASAGPTLKPFKVLTPTTKPEERAASADQPSAKPQEIKLTKAGEPGLSSVETAPPFPETETTRSTPASGGVPLPDSLAAAPAGKPSLSLSAPAKSASDKAEAAEKKKAPVAQASKKPLLIVLGVAFALITAAVVAGVYWFSGKGAGEGAKTPGSATSSATEPVQPPPPVTDAGASTTSTPTPEPAATTTTEPSSSGPVVAPRTRNPEVELWLRNAVITAVSTQRVTLNGKVFMLNSIVSPIGNLRWIGRDTVTRDLLFMDDAGVIYNKPVGGSAR